ncbi:MAG: SpoIID/LytB domain-containing protein [Syntrophaceae bacterium]|nr:SpoIID/LytB domain-containing protein [Syntrophaceae bacterium]
MITCEPKIKVGILEGRQHIRGELNGLFIIEGYGTYSGIFTAESSGSEIILKNAFGKEIIRKNALDFLSSGKGDFNLFNVAIGIHFHWERSESQTFRGDLMLTASDDGMMTAVNIISLEDYLVSVISSEMSSEAPLEFLKAHAVMSRSWLGAMLARKDFKNAMVSDDGVVSNGEDEHIRWYDTEEHHDFDVCADDHCQRYQGIMKSSSGSAADACRATRGIFLIYDNRICDARYHKCCGGLTDNFENTWENVSIPYLTSVSDAEINHHPILNETDARKWIMSDAEAFCNTKDQDILRKILPAFDQETTDFFRWRFEYSRQELEDIILSKSAIDFGTLLNLTPVERGPSSRIIRLKIEGSARSVIIGKELEIRRCLSRTHLYSSAFIVAVKRERGGKPDRFIFQGAGWGHGVGLCQIGAAVMAEKGYKAEDILHQYFRGAQLKKLY